MNTFESVLMRWMKPEPVIQNEVIQKEKQNSCILIHIYGIWSDSINNPTFKAAKKTQI